MKSIIGLGVQVLGVSEAAEGPMAVLDLVCSLIKGE